VTSVFTEAANGSAPDRLPAPSRPRQRPGVALGTAFGTFGELLQGALPCTEGEGRFLVTLPIARWSKARFEARPAGGLTVWPEHKTKALRLTRTLLEEIGAPVTGAITLTSSLSEGKGLASSSADLVACAQAVTVAYGVDFPLDLLGALLAEIEPTDGVLHDGVVAFDHRRGRLLRRLGSLPQLSIVAVDEGGQVDTVAFNRRRVHFSPALRDVYGGLLDELTHAVATGDLALVGRIATRSAELNQAGSPKRLLQAMTELCQELSGLGVVATHSGTMLGLLLDPTAQDHPRRLAAAVRACCALTPRVSVFQTLAFD
jgi:uncharacterized protein involved in propanediol utilization